MKGYKTLIVALAVAIGGVLQTFNWATVIPQDKTWSGVVMLAIGAAIAALRFVTSTPVGVKSMDSVAKILVAAFVLALFLAGDPAHAGKLAITGNPIKDIQTDISNVTGGGNGTGSSGSNPIASIISKPLQDLATFISGDLAGAAELAVSIPNIQDGNGQACWQALEAAGQVFKAHPVPLTLQAATDLEALRLLVMTANKICTNSACTQVFTDTANIIQAAAPVPLPIPGLTSLCAKVPEIAVVAPSAAAAAPAVAPAK